MSRNRPLRRDDVLGIIADVALGLDLLTRALNTLDQGTADARQAAARVEQGLAALIEVAGA